MSFRRPSTKAARPFLIWYAATFTTLFMLLGVAVVIQGAPATVIPQVFAQAFLDLAPKWPFWVALLLPYLVFLWFRSVWRGCRRGGAKALASSLLLQLALPIALVIGTYKAARWHATSERFDYSWDDSVHNTTGYSIDRYSRDGKHRGVHVFGRTMTEAAIEPLLENNIEWIVLVPFGWQDKYDDPSVRFTALDGLEWADKDKFYIDQIEVAKARGIRSIVKPHLWLTGGSRWRSEISMSSDDHWKPLTAHRQPTIDELTRSWNAHVQALETLSRHHAKPVLFTELGYKSVPGAAIEPWEWMRWPNSLFGKVSTETQYNCYEAFFRSLWEKDWFAGVHFWQWALRHDDAGGTSKPSFTPQNKPAQNCMAKWFAREVP